MFMTPRFLICSVSYAYGPRDEVTHSLTRVADVAYTRAWAERLADAFASAWGLDRFPDAGDVIVLDTRPEPVAPVPALDCDPDDLPF